MAKFTYTKIFHSLEELKSLIQDAHKKYLGAEEAAKFLGFKKSYLYNLVSNNEIPHYKPKGKKLLFDESELIDWIKKTRVATRDEYAEKMKRKGN